MKVPTIDSQVKIKVKNFGYAAMIPPQPQFTIYEGKVLPKYKWLTEREFCLSGDKNWPIRVIDINTVENIDLLSGSFNEINTDVKVIEIQGSKGNKYIVTKTSKSITCTCPGFQFRKQCKHIT